MVRLLSAAVLGPQPGLVACKLGPGCLRNRGLLLPQQHRVCRDIDRHPPPRLFLVARPWCCSSLNKNSRALAITAFGFAELRSTCQDAWKRQGAITTSLARDILHYARVAARQPIDSALCGAAPALIPTTTVGPFVASDFFLSASLSRDPSRSDGRSSRLVRKASARLHAAWRILVRVLKGCARQHQPTDDHADRLVGGSAEV